MEVFTPSNNDVSLTAEWPAMVVSARRVTPRRRPGRQRDQLRRALALVHAPREAPELRVGGAEQGVVAAQVHRRHARIRRRPAAESRRAGAPAERKSDPVIELLRLPGSKPLGDLLRETIRIGGGMPSLVRKHRRRLVMLAAAATSWRQGGHDIGTDGADHPHEVAEDLLPAPPLEGLLDAEGVAEVDGAGEVLLGAVQPVGGVQLLGPQHRQGVEQLGADFVLPSVAARRREQHGAVALPPGQLRQQRVVLVVGMGHDRHEGAGAVELAQGHSECRPSLTGRERLGVGGPETAGADQERHGKRGGGESIGVHDAPSIAAHHDPPRDRAGVEAPVLTAGASRPSTAR